MNLEQLQTLKQILLTNDINMGLRTIVRDVVKSSLQNKTINQTLEMFTTMDDVYLTSLSRQELVSILDQTMVLFVSDVVNHDDDASMISEEEFKAMVEQVNKASPKNDRMSWLRLNRELKKHVEMVDEINPEYFELREKRQKILDHIDDLRNKMLDECIHPEEYLTLKNGCLYCKFCNQRIRVVVND